MTEPYVTSEDKKKVPLPIIQFDIDISRLKIFGEGDKRIVCMPYSLNEEILLVKGYLRQEGDEDGGIFVCLSPDDVETLTRKEAEAVYGAKPWVIENVKDDPDFIRLLKETAEEIRKKDEKLTLEYLGVFI